MGRVLLAVEADRIQDLVFRSSRLREVTGGSYALERFWRDAAALAREEPFGAEEVPVAAGGNLRALFSGPDARGRADAFGRAVADLYRVEIGGSVVVARAGESGASPAPSGNAGDADLSRRASRALARAKAGGRPAEASAHFSYLRPCGSCGRDGAVVPLDERRTDVGPRCRVCFTREELRDEFQEAFLGRLRSMDEAPPSPARIGHLPEMADTVGTLDPRGRVAYLLADGNGFGVLFQRTIEKGGFEALEKLSRAVREAGTGAIADATAALLRHLPEDDLPRHSDPASPERPLCAPVLPLITGGDDVFVLLPARWAFWFAERFAACFRQRMQRDAGREVSVSCALVFCKATFPYRFAHEVGERALGEAKRAARSLAAPAGAGEPAVPPALLRAVEVRTMVPDAALGPPGEYGVFALDGEAPAICVPQLLKARRALAHLPAKRRHELEALFGEEGRGGDAMWAERAAWLLQRIEREARASEDVRSAMTALAGGSSTYLCPSPLGDGAGNASAMVDLLHHWDFLHDPDPHAAAHPTAAEPILAEVAG